MATRRINRAIPLVTRCIWTLLVLFAAAGIASAQEKVGIIPFKVFGPYEVQYLKDAIPEMLYSRLPAAKKEIVKKETLSEALKGTDAKDELGQAKKFLDAAGYSLIVMGSYTRMGDSFSLDVKVLKKGANEFKTFFVSMDKEGKLFDAVNDIAQKISAFAAGKEIKEKIVVKEEGDDKKAFRRIKAIELTYAPYGVVLADVDGDAKKELVVAAMQSLKIYRIDGENLTPVFEYEIKGAEFLSMDALDINKNGKDEILLVTLKFDDPMTQVLDVSNGAVKKLFEAAWYVRVINTADKGNMLIGQRNGSNDAFYGVIHTLTIKGNEFFAETPLKTKKELNIYSLLPLKYRGKNMIAYFDSEDFLRIMDDKGKVLERLKDRYNGSMLSVKKGLDDNREPKITSIHSRFLRLNDSEDADAIMLIKNQGGRLFLRSKALDQGQIVHLKYDGVNYKEAAASEVLDGYLSDFAFDAQNDKVYATVVTESKEGRIFIFSK